MKKETKQIKVSISNVEDMESIENEIEALKNKYNESKISNNFNEANIIKEYFNNNTVSTDYEKQVKNNYDFLISMNRSEKSYELIENYFDIHFRKIIYECIVAFITDKEKAIEIYNSNQVNKLMKDIDEYISSMLHLTQEQMNDFRMKAYLTKLLQNIGTSISFFYGLYNFDTNHKSYNEIMQYLFAFMIVIYPAN